MRLIESVERVAARLDAAGLSFGHGTTNAFDEAAWLVLWRLSLPLHALDAFAQRALTADEEAAIDALVGERIATRKPAAYLTGEAWLQGLPFHVDERVIVPRSPIAEVIAEGLAEPWLGESPARILDLCTGNGSLAVIAALAWREAQVDATDLSADALAVAARNVARHGLHHRGHAAGFVGYPTVYQAAAEASASAQAAPSGEYLRPRATVVYKTSGAPPLWQGDAGYVAQPAIYNVQTVLRRFPLTGMAPDVGK